MNILEYYLNTSVDTCSDHETVIVTFIIVLFLLLLLLLLLLLRRLKFEERCCCYIYKHEIHYGFIHNHSQRYIHIQNISHKHSHICVYPSTFFPRSPVTTFYDKRGWLENNEISDKE